MGGLRRGEVLRPNGDGGGDDGWKWWGVGEGEWCWRKGTNLRGTVNGTQGDKGYLKLENSVF